MSNGQAAMLMGRIAFALQVFSKKMLPALIIPVTLRQKGGFWLGYSKHSGNGCNFSFLAVLS